MLNRKLLFAAAAAALAVCGCSKDDKVNESSIDSSELVSMLKERESRNVGDELKVISSKIDELEQTATPSETVPSDETTQESMPEETVESLPEQTKEPEPEETTVLPETTEVPETTAQPTTPAPTTTAVETVTTVEPAVPAGVDVDYLNQLCAGTHMVPYGVVYTDSSDESFINKLYQNTVVVGDSRVEGVVWVLDSSKVFYERGGHAGSMLDIASQAGAMYPDKALFYLGLNDMAVYCDDTASFIADYEAMVNELLSYNSSCKIYICAQTRVTAAGLASFPAAARIGAYNQAMQQMCADNGWTYVDGSTYLLDSYFASDGLHYNVTYYRYWIQDMAVQMDLWGDLLK